MTVAPVIVREMRASARQPFTYTARMCGAGVLVGVAALLGLQGYFAADAGGRLFFALNRTLFVALWVLVPLMTADCISRERREGTLPLLFLTPLRAHEIVLAKSIAHGLRALTLWLGVVPVLTIPILLGGVSWPQATVSALLDFASLCVALSAGIMASAWSKVWHRAIISALVLAGLFFLTLACVAGFFFLTYGSSRLSWPGSADYGLTMGLGILLGASRNAIMRLSQTPLLISAAYTAVFALLMLALAIVIAGRSVRRNWQERPRSALAAKLENVFCTPVVWKGFFRQWMRWKLERNPLGWLEQRTWSGRLVMWSLLAVMVSFYSAVFTGSFFARSFTGLQLFLAWVTLGSLAMSAAGSFRRERETGVLELLLVSPLNEWEILHGRLRGLWGQYLPAMGLVIAVWLYLGSLDRDTPFLSLVVFFTLTFLTLPVIGLYFSLAKDGFISALVWTILVALVLPAILPLLLGFVAEAWFRSNGPVATPLYASMALELAFGGVFALWLHSNLRRRRFKLDRKMI
jgi:ABC-type transport system involved in multi-copper enzyme maturation permease subunit